MYACAPLAWLSGYLLPVCAPEPVLCGAISGSSTCWPAIRGVSPMLGSAGLAGTLQRMMSCISTPFRLWFPFRPLLTMLWEHCSPIYATGLALQLSGDAQQGHRVAISSGLPTLWSVWLQASHMVLGHRSRMDKGILAICNVVWLRSLLSPHHPGLCRWTVKEHNFTSCWLCS